MRTGKSASEKIRHRSSRQLLTVWLLLFFGLLFVILSVSWLYFFRLVRQKVVESASNQLQICAAELQLHLTGAGNELNKMSLALLDAPLLNCDTDDETALYFAANSCAQQLSGQINYTDYADGYFVKVPDADLVLSSYTGRITSGERAQINRALYENTFEDTPAVWQYLPVGDTPCLFKWRQVGGLVSGVMIKVESLQNASFTLTASGDAYLFTDPDGNILCRSASAPDPLAAESGSVTLLDAPLSSAQVCLTRVLDNASWEFTLPAVPVIVAVFFAVSSLMSFWLYLFTKRQLVEPANSLNEAIRTVEAGNWELEVPQTSTVSELHNLESSFNSMVRQIKHYKNQSYEEKLRRQRIELRHLQRQIRPHFYLNALTTIHSLICLKKGDEACAFILALSEHLRYTIQDNLTQVSLERELKQVDRYFQMQAIRFPKSVFWQKDAAPEALSCSLPQFLVLTLAENAVKHALTLNSVLCMLIQASCEPGEGAKPTLRIVTEDNGPGFSDAMLAVLNGPPDGGENIGEHIGLLNLKKTLDLLYGDEANIRFSNALPHGARIEILIPQAPGETPWEVPCEDSAD